MRARVVDLADDVEEERLDVIVERLVVEEELREEAQVLAVDSLVLRVDLKDRDIMVLLLLPIDLVARRVEELALGRQVPLELLAPREKVEVKLADVERVGAVVLLAKRREVPRLHTPAAHHDAVDVLHLGRLLVLLERRQVELALLLVLLRLVLALRRARHLAVLRLRAEVEALERHPLVEPPVEALVVHVVPPLARVLVLLPVDDLARFRALVAPLAEQFRAELERLGLHRRRVRAADGHVFASAEVAAAAAAAAAATRATRDLFLSGAWGA